MSTHTDNLASITGPAYSGSKTIGRLPVELLNESFSYLNSIDLLAVTRTCKAICRILTDPHSSFVWKRARHNFNVDSPVPEPTPNWTEPALAYMLFTPKHCEVLVHSLSPFHSAIGIRFARKWLLTRLIV